MSKKHVRRLNRRRADGFRSWLRKQFFDLETAKWWVCQWHKNLDQKTPFGTFSMRAMAGHVSDVLCGGPYNATYLETKHGLDLYWAMCEKPRPIRVVFKSDRLPLCYKILQNETSQP